MCLHPICVMLWGTSVSQWASLKAYQHRQQQTLPMRVRLHVCACTLKPSECSRLQRDPSTWLNHHTSFCLPLFHINSSCQSVDSECCFPPRFGVSCFSPFPVFFLHTQTHTRSLTICTEGLFYSGMSMHVTSHTSSPYISVHMLLNEYPFIFVWTHF